MSRSELLERLNAIDELIIGMTKRKDFTYESYLNYKDNFKQLADRYYNASIIQGKAIERLRNAFNITVTNYINQKENG